MSVAESKIRTTAPARSRAETGGASSQQRRSCSPRRACMPSPAPASRARRASRRARSTCTSRTSRRCFARSCSRRSPSCARGRSARSRASESARRDPRAHRRAGRFAEQNRSLILVLFGRGHGPPAWATRCSTADPRHRRGLPRACAPTTSPAPARGRRPGDAASSRVVAWWVEDPTRDQDEVIETLCRCIGLPLRTPWRASFHIAIRSTTPSTATTSSR
jgi:hypothetical protein